jgi:hypothetical protein
MIILVRTVQTSSACPAQWDAWDADGNYYYLRFRHGHGTVQAMDEQNPNYQSGLVAHFIDDDPWNGSIELADFAARAAIGLSTDLEEKGFAEYFNEALTTAIDEVGDEQ